MTKMNCKIYCCTHKPVELPCEDEIYELLQTGRAYDKVLFNGMSGDDTGDNISEKKDIYDGLLTGMYWIWKNTDYDVVGVCQYHRYLANCQGTILKREDIENLFADKKYEICVYEDSYGSSVEENLRAHNFYYNNFFDPIQEIRNSIMELEPNYLDAFDFTLNKKIICSRNVFVMNRHYYDMYCSWLFSIFFDVENRLREKNYPFPYRFFGFIAERMERAFIIMQDANVCTLPIVSTDGIY